MQLTLWTYEGPPHVGAMRIATAMEKVHYVLHAPQGDTYADLLFTMIERLPKRPPVTYTTFQARDLGSDTAEIFKNAAREAYERFAPQAIAPSQGTEGLRSIGAVGQLCSSGPGNVCDADGHQPPSQASRGAPVLSPFREVARWTCAYNSRKCDLSGDIGRL